MPKEGTSDPVLISSKRLRRYKAAPLPGVEELATAVLVLDRTRCVVALNAAAEHLFSESRRALLGKAIEQLLSPEEQVTEAFAQVEACGWHYTSSDLALTRSDGTLWRVEASISPFESQQGFILELRSIERIREVHAREMQAHRQHAVQMLIRRLAHEIKNPLGGIRGAAQLLSMELAHSELAEYAQVIVAETDRLARLVAQLGEETARPHLTPGNVHEALERARALILAEYPQLTIRRDYDVSLPMILMDMGHLVQLFLNLIKNAAEAMKGEGMIKLRTRAARQITLGKKRWPLAVHVMVEDHGPGIPKELHAHLFEPLVSTKPQGSGLGLAVALEVITAHGGTITFESEPGLTVFHCYFPLPEALR